MNEITKLHILHTDNDLDDCQLFNDALAELDMDISLLTLNDGDQLMHHLEKVSGNLPFALFLDLNMPRKNGFECLTEIKNHSTLKNLPVIIYSTSYNKEMAEELYNLGASYYISKPSDFEELKNVVRMAILLLEENKFQPSKEIFYINKLKMVW